MHRLLRPAASLGTAAMIATSLTVVGASPAGAVEREFNVGGAEVDFDVDKENGRFEVDVDLEDARPGSKWRIKLWHDGRRYFSEVLTANRVGEIEIDRSRRDTRGDDVFKVKVRKVGTDAVKSRTITLR